LRRSKTREDDNDSGSDTGSLHRTITQPANTSSAASMSTSTAGSIAHGHKSTMSNMSLTSVSGAKNGKLVSPAQDKGVTIEQSVKKFRIFEALRNGDTASISKAIKESAEGVTRTSTSSATANSPNGLVDTTILHLAIQCAETPVVEFVLSEGSGTIDVNARDKDGNTPLHVAAQQGRGHIVRMLLEQEGINDAVPNYQGRLPLDLARTPDIFQQLQLCRSIFVDGKIKQIQQLIAGGDYKMLGEVLEEPRVKTVLDINGGEFASDITTVQSGGTLLHEAARKKNAKLIQVLLLHGADPFRRDRRGKLPQDVTKDETTRSMLKRSPAAVAAQRGIQEKAVLGNANSQGAMASAPGDTLVGKESREMKGYLKKWTNYRKGYQLRWFVLEDGVLSYYKHQDDTGSACRGAINMRIAKLNMDPTEKQKFEIIGKSSVKYALRANHEVEAKRWFWALNNSIQWTKDQAKEEERQRLQSAEMLKQAKAEHFRGPSGGASTTELGVDIPDTRRNSTQSTRLMPQGSLGKASGNKVAFVPGSAGGSVADDDEGTAFGSYEPSYMGEASRIPSHKGAPLDIEDDDEDFQDDSSKNDVPASKDAFDITAQSARLQLEMMAQVNAALQSEQTRSPATTITDSVVAQAISTNDGSIRSLKGLVGDLLKISKDRDAYWQRRLDREADMRRMWEDSMAKVAREQEVLETRVGESEEKRKRTKRALREAIENSSRPQSRSSITDGKLPETIGSIPLAADGTALRRRSTAESLGRRKSILAEMANISDSESEVDEEFFDAIDAGEIAVAPMMPTSPIKFVETSSVLSKELVLSDDASLSTSFHGYEDGIRKRLKMDADDRPKISLWVRAVLPLI
jgi:ankyrin repeat protein